MKKSNFLIDKSDDFFKDNRGYLKVVYDKSLKVFKNFNIKYCFSVFNNSHKTFRGIHFQINPFSQNKLILINSGRIIDFVIDLRKSSKTFLKVNSFKVSSNNNYLIYVPKGFGHAYYTLENNTSLTYFTDQKFNLNKSFGINYKDKLLYNNFCDLDIKYISKKDDNLPYLEEALKKIKF